MHTAGTRIRQGIVAALLACACQSSGRYAVPAAAINTAAGVSAAVQQRAAGGCYATCVGGTQCNPHTGFCEAMPCGACPAGEACVVTASGFACSAGGSGGAAGAGLTASQRGSPPPLLPGLGVSPVPPPPPPAGPERPHHEGP